MAGKMAQQTGAPASKLDDMTLVLRTSMVIGVNFRLSSDHKYSMGHELINKQAKNEGNVRWAEKSL